jgi:hypothetical protein
MLASLTLAKLLVIVGGYLLLLISSGVVVNNALGRIPSVTLKGLSRQVRDTGMLVGKCENILIMTFMLLQAYTALGLIFAAKGLVRREASAGGESDRAGGRETYYVAGTIVNLTWSILLALAVKLALRYVDC